MQVLKGYLLQKLFGPGVADVTSDQNILYLDFPSNMVCLFLPLLHNCMHRLSDASLDFWVYRLLHFNDGKMNSKAKLNQILPKEKIEEK